MTTTPSAALPETFVLAEGPVWDAPTARLLWVDIVGGLVLEGALDGDAIHVQRRHAFEETIGAVVPAADGRLLVAGQERLIVIDADGARHHGPRVLPTGAGRRLNDGATDPAGRFLVGSMRLWGVPTGTDVLVRLERDGTLTELDTDLRLSNGLAWSVDGTRMYSADSLHHAVFVRAYDPLDGAVGERAVHLDLGPLVPDGIAVDSADHLWVALWGVGQVRRYAPDGLVRETIELPAPHTSSVAFAGDDLRTLVITTARDQLTQDQLRAHPESGRVFCARVDTPGCLTAAWAG